MKVLMAALALLAAANVACAGIQWTWVNAGTGTEQGMFITDGELVGGLAPPATYMVRQFTVSASAHGLMIGGYPDGGYICSLPDVGFDWDGSGCSCFWRDSGTWTNGFDFVVSDPLPDAPDMVAFGVGYFVACLEETIDYLSEDQTPVLTPVSTIVANEDLSVDALNAVYR